MSQPDASDGAQVTAPDQAAWLEGRLPPSVLEGTPRAGGELVVAIDVEPSSLNPLIVPDWLGKHLVLGRVVQALVRIDAHDDPEYRIVPELAERWEVSPDGRSYTFQLRRGVHWHDGKPFTARDVIATLDKIRDPSTAAANARAEFGELIAYRAPDDFTVVLEWQRAYFMVLDLLAELPIQPAHVIAQLSGAQYNEARTNPLNRSPLGTGPYKFVDWQSQSRIVLARNAHYWGKSPYIDRLVFRVVPDRSVRLQLAERAEVDFVLRVSADEWQHMDRPVLRQHWHRSRFYGAKYHWIGWNLQHPLFSDVRVRKALTLLIDRPSIIAKLLYGLPRPTTCNFYWASAACDPAQRPWPYDPEEAARLLDAADVRDHDGDGLRDRAGTQFRFTLTVPSSAGELLRVAAKIQEDLGHAGIDMRLETLAWSGVLARVRAHQFDATSLVWGGNTHTEPTSVWHSASIADASNFIGYRNAEVDRLIDEARATSDAEVRAGLYRQLGRFLHEEQPYTFLFVPPELDLLHARVKGARPSLAWWQFEELWLAEPRAARDSGGT